MRVGRSPAGRIVAVRTRPEVVRRTSISPSFSRRAISSLTRDRDDKPIAAASSA